jgi:trigger factor
MAETATKSDNKVTITDAGPSLKKIAIEVPADAVSERIAESMDTLSLEADVPGFRKGRAPRKLIERRFGTAVRGEAKNQIVAAAYSQAIEDHKLRVVGEPTSETLGDVEIEEGKPLSFELEVEVLPEFDLPKLEGIKVLKPQFEVSDEDVDEELRKICINEGDLEERDEPEPGDYLTGHGVMVGGPDDEEFYDIKGAVVQVPTKDKKGEGMILGIKVDDFAKQLGLPKPGETATIKAKGPEHHEIEGIRGADLTMTFKVERIDRIIPAKLETIVANFGFESEDQFKDMVRSRLQQRSMVRQQNAMRQQVARHLIEETEMALPERMTTQQALRNLERRRMEMMYSGQDAAAIEEKLAEARGATQEAAARELKLFFIMNKAAEDLEVKVEEPEVNGRIAQMAMEQGVRPEKLRQDLIQNNRVNSLVLQIREHKTMDAILEKAEIEEVSPEEFEKQMKKG